MDEKLYIAKYASVKIRLSKNHLINELWLLQNHADLSMEAFDPNTGKHLECILKLLNIYML